VGKQTDEEAWLSDNPHKVEMSFEEDVSKKISFRPSFKLVVFHVYFCYSYNGFWLHVQLMRSKKFIPAFM
jgi:hypothetical protein